MARSTWIAWTPTSGSARRSPFLPGPAVRVARIDFRHHSRKGLVEVDALRVSEADHDEDNVRELHRDRPLGLFLLLGLLAEPMVDLPGELTDLLGESCEIRERWEVSLLILADPAIDHLLSVAKSHQESPSS